MAKILCLGMMVLVACVAWTMPTAHDLASARSDVRELTADMDAAAVVDFVGKAETEAQRYALIVRAAELYVKVKDYGAAASMLESLYTAMPRTWDTLG